MEHPQLVEGSSPPPTAAAAATNGQEDSLRLCEANLARLALLGRKGREAAARGGRSSGSHSGRGGSYIYKGGARTASVGSAAGSMVVKKRCGGGMAPSVTTAGTGLSVAETVIARAQARKGMF
jgi:hypothetical protein